MAADGHGGRVGVGVVHEEAGDVFEEFTDVALGDFAEHVGRDRSHEVVRLLLFVDLGGVALDFAGDDERAEFVDAGGEREILGEVLPGADGDCLFLAIETRVRNGGGVGAGFDVE